MESLKFVNYPHRRKNILTGEWILVSPHRTERPWRGEVTNKYEKSRKSYEPDCYLCPGNKRANGVCNPDYKGTYVFSNDFPALLMDIPIKENVSKIKHGTDFLLAKNERGICKVVVFTPRHDITLAEMGESDIENVIITWQNEYRELSSIDFINYIQIFENKGVMMGCSNPHPHCQIWAQESIPVEPKKELVQFRKYYKRTGRSLLSDYAKLEIRLKERVVHENDSFLVLVPFWAIWPYETIVIPKRKISNILELKEHERKDFANILKVLTVKYDNLFQTAFPYSAGLHQAPTDGKEYKEWHLHMHFYPPLLRSASIKKFMVGYEMLAEPQRDITPEKAAEILRNLKNVHYKVEIESITS